MDRYSTNQNNAGALEKGWDVYGSDGDKVGSIAEVESQYIVAHKGFFFPKDLYIPMSAIQRTEGDRVYLGVTKDEVDSQGWDTYPNDMGSGTATGTARPSIPDAIGTPGLAGSTDEGGRNVPAAGTGGWGNAAPAADVAGTAAPAGKQTEGDRLYLHEEELRATKQRQQVGEVRIGKEAVEEQRTLNVPVTREEVTVEYVPGDRQPDQHPIEASAGQTLRVPVSEETVNVEKVPVVSQEVRVGKRQVQEVRQVSGTVRREEARVEDTGNVRVERPAGEERDTGKV